MGNTEPQNQPELQDLQQRLLSASEGGGGRSPEHVELPSPTDTEAGGNTAEAHLPRDLPLLGLALCALSTVFLTAAMVLVKFLGQGGLPVFEILLVRVATILIISWGSLLRRGVSPLGNRRDLLILRGVLGGTAASCYFWAVNLMHLAEATVLTFLAPLMVALLAPIVLKEPLSRATLVVAPLCVLGVWLIAQPDYTTAVRGSRQTAGVTLACLQAFFAGCAKMVVRELRKSDNPDVIVFYSAAMTAVGAAAGCIWKGVRWPNSPEEFSLLLATGVLGYLTQISFTTGLKYAPAAPAIAMSYLSVVWTLAAGFVVFGEVPGWKALAAAALICSCMLSLTVVQRQAARH